MKQKTPQLPVWLHITLWSVYIAVISLYGEFIISRPVDGWIQSVCTVVVLIGTYYWIRFTIKSVLYNKQKSDKP